MTTPDNVRFYFRILRFFGRVFFQVHSGLLVVWFMRDTQFSLTSPVQYFLFDAIRPIFVPYFPKNFDSLLVVFPEKKYRPVLSVFVVPAIL